MTINPQTDYDEDLQTEYEAIRRKEGEIWQERRRLAVRRKENLRMPDMIETHEEDERLSAWERRLDEREAACSRNYKEVKKKHLRRQIEKTVAWGKRNPSDKGIQEHEQSLRAALYKLESET